MQTKALLALILCFACPTLWAEEKSMDNEATVTVQGQSELSAEPDHAVIRLGVTHSAATAAAAQSQVNRQMQAVLDAVRRLGVPDQAIQTTQISLSPEYASRRGDTPVLSGYRASNTVSIRIDRLEMVGDVFDAATEVGGNEIQGIQFDLKDDTQIRLQALREAARSAHAKAAVMADALGMKLGRVIELSESNVQIRPMLQQTRMMMEASSGAPVAPGQITISATVTLRCALQE